jgi:hypothetical protein
LPGIAVYAIELPLTSFIMYQLGQLNMLIRVQSVSAVVRSIVVALTVPHFGIAAAAASSLIYVVVMLVYGLTFVRSSGIGLAQFVLLQPTDLADYRRLAKTVWHWLPRVA